MVKNKKLVLELQNGFIFVCVLLKTLLGNMNYFQSGYSNLFSHQHIQFPPVSTALEYLVLKISFPPNFF